jgi:hypothetical protein
MDNPDRNREREQEEQNPPSGQSGRDRGQDQSQRPMADRTGGQGTGAIGESGSTENEDLQREGNLGNERNRNPPDRAEQTGNRDNDRNP